MGLFWKEITPTYNRRNMVDCAMSVSMLESKFSPYVFNALFYPFNSNMCKFYANSVDHAASDLGLHCLPILLMGHKSLMG